MRILRSPERPFNYMGHKYCPLKGKYLSPLHLRSYSKKPERDACLITLLMIKEKNNVFGNSVLLIKRCLSKGYVKSKYIL